MGKYGAAGQATDNVGKYGTAGQVTDNVGKYGTAGQATDDNIIGRTRILWRTRRLQTHTQNM